MEQLVKRLVDYNYGIPLYPTISLAPINEQDLLALSTPYFSIQVFFRFSQFALISSGVKFT